MEYKIGDRVQIIKSNHPDIKHFINEVYFIEGIDTRGFGDIPYKIHLVGLDPWVLPEELAPLSVKYTELAKFMYPDGHKEGDRWILK